MKNNAAVDLVVQMAAPDAAHAGIPTQADFEHWVGAAWSGGGERFEVCLRIVGSEEAADLNRRYRGRCGPTNVLSFPCTAPLPPARAGEPKPLGDIVIAADVVELEARAQSKPVMGHWAHLFIHGMLHLQGYDHVEEDDALRMEAQEAAILNQLGFADPYWLGPCLVNE